MGSAVTVGVAQMVRHFPPGQTETVEVTVAVTVSTGRGLTSVTGPMSVTRVSGTFWASGAGAARVVLQMVSIDCLYSVRGWL